MWAAVIEEHERLFPPDKAVTDLLTTIEPGSEQVAALMRLVAAEDRETVLTVVASWCLPCQRAWADFVAAAKQDRGRRRWVAIAFEDDIDGGLETTNLVRLLWNDGADVTLPAYMVLDVRGRARRSRLFPTLSAALGPPGSAPDTAPGGAGPRDAAAALAAVRVDIDAGTVGDALDQVTRQTGVAFVASKAIRARPGSFSAKQTPVLVALDLLFGQLGLESATWRGSPDAPIVIAVWPRPVEDDVRRARAAARE